VPPVTPGAGGPRSTLVRGVAGIRLTSMSEATASVTAYQAVLDIEPSTRPREPLATPAVVTDRHACRVHGSTAEDIWPGWRSDTREEWDGRIPL
jgi:hypothetical protein